jgi:hypothetical protein
MVTTTAFYFSAGKKRPGDAFDGSFDGSHLVQWSLAALPYFL